MRWPILLSLIPTLALLWFGARREAAWVQAAAPDQPPPALHELLNARYQTALSLLEMEQKRLQRGGTTLIQVCEAARRVKDSALELPVSQVERLRALSNYVAVARELETNILRAADLGAVPPTDRESARYMRLDAEIALLRAQQPAAP